MSDHRTRGRRASQRAFRPTLDGRLESRLLLKHNSFIQMPIQTINGGRGVLITDHDGAQFEATLTSDLQVPTQPAITAGIIVAHTAPGGRFSLKVFGTTTDSILAINPVIKSPVKFGAHNVAVGQAGNDSILHIDSIKVVSGKISEIVGYHSADLSGQITATGTSAVNRIAFEALLPGAGIAVGGDLNTLDVLTSANLDGGPSIVVGRDLNWINTGGNLTLTGGSSLVVGRDIGLVAQPAKGTGPAGQGGLVQGNLVIGPGSQFVVGRSLAAPFVVNGNGTGMSRVFVGTPLNTFVFRPGAIVTP
jgi:hypothetical protein